MSTNELAIYSGDLMSDEELDTALREEMEKDSKRAVYTPRFERIKLPSGKGKDFSFPDGSELKTFEAVIVIAQQRRALYTTNEPGTLPPACYSLDFVTGNFRVSDEDDQVQNAIRLYSAGSMVHPALKTGEPKNLCRNCPLSAVGSGCKPKTFALLLMRETMAPFIFSFPTMSMKSFDAFATSERAKGQGTFQRWVEFSIETRRNGKNTDYPFVNLSPKDYLEKSQLGHVIAMRRASAAYMTGRDSLVDEEYTGPSNDDPGYSEYIDQIGDVDGEVIPETETSPFN